MGADRLLSGAGRDASPPLAPLPPIASLPAAAPTVAIVDWSHLLEDFLDTIGLSFPQFRDEMSGGWLFGCGGGGCCRSSFAFALAAPSGPVPPDPGPIARP